MPHRCPPLGHVPRHHAEPDVISHLSPVIAGLIGRRLNDVGVQSPIGDLLKPLEPPLADANRILGVVRLDQGGPLENLIRMPV
jgi:hypothetical protein